MARYRCYFLGSNSRLLGAESVESESDDEALAAAHRLFAIKAYAASFELWRGNTKVCVEHAKAS